MFTKNKKNELIKKINQLNKDDPYFHMDDITFDRMIENAKKHPFERTGYSPNLIEIWIEQLYSYIDNNDEESYIEKCKQIKSKGFDFLISVMEKSYGKEKLFK